MEYSFLKYCGPSKIIAHLNYMSVPYCVLIDRNVKINSHFFLNYYDIAYSGSVVKACFVLMLRVDIPSHRFSPQNWAWYFPLKMRKVLNVSWNSPCSLIHLRFYTNSTSNTTYKIAKLVNPSTYSFLSELLIKAHYFSGEGKSVSNAPM